MRFDCKNFGLTAASYYHCNMSLC